MTVQCFDQLSRVEIPQSNGLIHYNSLPLAHLGYSQPTKPNRCEIAYEDLALSAHSTISPDYPTHR